VTGFKADLFQGHAVLDEQGNSRVEVSHILLEHKVLLGLGRNLGFEVTEDLLSCMGVSKGSAGVGGRTYREQGHLQSRVRAGLHSWTGTKPSWSSASRCAWTWLHRETSACSVGRPWASRMKTTMWKPATAHAVLRPTWIGRQSLRCSSSFNEGDGRRHDRQRY
jgi:hypothetical protein